MMKTTTAADMPRITPAPMPAAAPANNAITAATPAEIESPSLARFDKVPTAVDWATIRASRPAFRIRCASRLALSSVIPENMRAGSEILRCLSSLEYMRWSPMMKLNDGR